ncbi:putative N-acetyltransferase YhbS [Bradyrhizobium sp. USDA 4529]
MICPSFAFPLRAVPDRPYLRACRSRTNAPKTPPRSAASRRQHSQQRRTAAAPKPASSRRCARLTISLVAVSDDGSIFGHVAFSPVRIEGVVGRWYGLGPVSVAPDLQRQGTGGALIRAGLARLAAMNADGCVLLGDPAYYSRFGFVSDPALTYGGEPSPYFQRLVLKGDPPKGDVKYHAAFDVT